MGCDRGISRKARKILNELVFAELQDDPSSLPEGCPFQPDHDLYLKQEEQKQSVRGAQWKCGICGKTFKSEFYLDRHFDNKHQDMLSHDAPVCLADWCDVLGCDQEGSHLHHLGGGGGGGGGCREDALARARLRCQATFYKCFPPEQDEVKQMYYSIFNREICGQLTCEHSNKKKLGMLSKMKWARNNIDMDYEYVHEPHPEAFQYGLLIIFMILLIIYYGYIAYYRKETLTRGDFRKPNHLGETLFKIGGSRRSLSSRKLD